MTAWRTIFTDSESMSGVAPVCWRQDDPDGPHWSPAGPTWLARVFDCCPVPHIETWGESDARKLADGLTRIDAQACS